MARRLLAEPAPMWFLLDQKLTETDRVEMLPALEAIGQFTEELRCRLGNDGVDGIDGAYALYERLRTTLDDIPRARLEEMRAEIARLATWLGDVLGRIEDLRRFKQVVV